MYEGLFYNKSRERLVQIAVREACEVSTHRAGVRVPRIDPKYCNLNSKLALATSYSTTNLNNLYTLFIHGTEGRTTSTWLQF